MSRFFKDKTTNDYESIIIVEENLRKYFPLASISAFNDLTSKWESNIFGFEYLLEYDDIKKNMTIIQSVTGEEKLDFEYNTYTQFQVNYINDKQFFFSLKDLKKFIIETYRHLFEGIRIHNGNKYTIYNFVSSIEESEYKEVYIDNLQELQVEKHNNKIVRLYSGFIYNKFFYFLSEIDNSIYNLFETLCAIDPEEMKVVDI